MTKRELHKLIRQFRILNDWDIKMVKDKEYAGQISINPKKKQAILYDWHGIAPNDFYLHEILHVALRELRCTKINKAYREIEEQLVQDICRSV